MKAQCRGRSRRRFAAALLVTAVSLLLGANPSPPENWSLSYETNPTNSDNVSQGASWFRQLKLDVRERSEVESHFGSINADDNGLMRVGSARCFVGTSAPTDIEQVDHDNTGGAGTSTLSDDATNSVPAEKVGHGRCWLDTDGADNTAGTIDDDTLWVYDSTDGWEEVTRLNDFNSEYVNYGINLLWNGSFEVGSGASAPDGWTAVNTPTITYSSTNTTEGSGQEIHITAAGGADEGIAQALAGLKGSTTYLVAVRSLALGGDTCSLRTTGGDSNVSATTAGSGAYETLTGAFTTDVAGSTVTVILEADVDTDVCRFDHGAVYEVGSTTVHPAVPSSSSWVVKYTTPAVGSVDTDHTIIESQDFIIESDSCFANVMGRLHATAACGSGTFSGNPLLQYDGNGAGYSTIDVLDNVSGVISGSTETMDGITTYAFNHVNTNWAAGNTAQFRLYWDNTGTCGGGPPNFSYTANYAQHLTIEMICP